METLLHGMLSNAAAVTVLAATIAIAGRLSRRPALIHSVCLLAMLKLVTPPVVSLPVPGAATWFVAAPAPVLPGPDDPPAAHEVADAEPTETPTLLDDTDVEWLLDEPILEDIPAAAAAPASWSWEAMALGLVLSGTLAWWAVAAVRIVRFDRLLRDVEPMPAEWRAEAAALAARLGLRRPPSAYLVPGDLPPMLWAFGRRVRLLVPSRLWATLGDDERTALLLHELAHLRRRDHWVRWLELAVAGLYWWHPAVWWIRRALREAEEQCCDAWVVSAMPRGGAKTYAAALVAALEFVSGARTAPAAAASATIGTGHVSSLKRRLRMIVRAKTPRGLSWAGRLAVAGLSALLLPLAPSWAEKEPAPASYVEQNRKLESIGDRIAARLEVIEAKAALDSAQAQPNAEQVKAGNATRSSNSLEKTLKRELDKLDEAAQKKFAELKELAMRSHVAVEGRSKELTERAKNADQLEASLLSQDLAYLRRNRDVIRAKLGQLALANAQDKDSKPKDEKADEPKKDAEGREASARVEEELKALKEKLGKDLDPVADVVRKSLDRALDELHQTLKKEGITADDLRRAVEKSRKELHESLRRGGPVEKEMREAADRARKDLQDAMERQMRETMRGREEMKGRSEESREQQKKAAEATREQMRKRAEQQRQANQERQALARREAERVREATRARIRRQPEEKKESRPQAESPKPESPKPESPKPEEKPPAGDREKAERGGSGREELNAAREQIRELRERLREANSRLQQLERSETRRPERAARPATPADPARPVEPRPAERPARPAPPADPARPAARRPAERPARPATPREAREGDDYDRRFRDLEDKMNRLLKELEEIKGRSTSDARSPSR